MVNKEIARQFSLLASLMELHGENAFKTKAYSGAYLVLRKWDKPITDMDEDAIAAIPGIGKSVSTKIVELLSTGKIDALEKLKVKTPEGIQELLSVKGLGPKKIRAIWDELSIESPAELLYACEENRLVKLSGFGLKTQEDLRQKIAYFLDSRHRYLYGNIEQEMFAFQDKIRHRFPGHRIEWAGDFATRNPVVSKLECLIAPFVSEDDMASLEKISISERVGKGVLQIVFDERFIIHIHACDPDDFVSVWSKLTMAPALFDKLSLATEASVEDEISEALKKSGYERLPVELFDVDNVAGFQPNDWADLVTEENIKGILHNHSTWSDGINTLEEMSKHVREKGYQYFAICDHSRSAFYANGLSVERVYEQMEEIDRINQQLAPFKVFKGIESDILGDGSLDYEEDVLKKFDLVVASIHSNLRMDEEKAMSRLLTAIENPYTRILGHPTGRLLLARPGYPVNHKKVIDACAANGVAIELNANPNRMDIDFTWIRYCMEKEVLVSINPDAHSRAQVDYVKYGVYAARKGGLKADFCLNALSLDAFEKWLRET